MTYKYNPPTGNVADTRADIKTEFQRWDAQAGERVISDYDLPYANAGLIAAEVVFILRGQKIRVHIDRWDSFATNLRCAYLNIRDMRLAEARGSLEAMRETLMALPSPEHERDAFEVLGVRPDAPMEVIESSYKALAHVRHPDHGGSDAAMTELNAAFDKVKAGRAVTA